MASYGTALAISIHLSIKDTYTSHSPSPLSCLFATLFHSYNAESPSFIIIVIISFYQISNTQCCREHHCHHPNG